MADVIGFFSSDAKPRYIEGVYEALTLPSKSIMHFRYNQKHLEDDIANNLNSYKGKDGVMFFVTGNDPTKSEEERNKKYHSIRKIVIRNVSKSADTGFVHFYLELGDYYDCSLNSFQRSKFVTRVSVIEGIKNKWIDRVEVVKDYFDDVLFFKYEILTKKNKLILPTFSELDNDATFHLYDESEYILRCSYFDKLNGKSSLSIADTELLAIHHKESSNIATKIDDRNYKMITNSISQNKTPVQIRFAPNPMPNGDKNYEVISFFEIRKSFLNTLVFGIVTALAFASVLLSQVFGVFVKDSKPLFDIISIGAIALLLIGVSGAILYRQFNKK